MVKGPLTLPLAVQFIWTLTDSLHSNSTTLSLSIRLHSHPYERSQRRKKRLLFRPQESRIDHAFHATSSDKTIHSVDICGAQWCREEKGFV
uniref:Putative secreted protein n=1 Tax=Anopheles marajoara TaxID=58244 RepID=A0A2M4CAC1_9DIPT